MMYPKPQRKKKRKKHKASILHCKDGTCYLCMKLKGDYRRYPVVHEHHIYDGPNRQNSEAEGLKVYLCLDHHIMGPEAVHNNHKNMRILHRDGQRAYERTHSRAEFMSLIGRNYLDEEKQEEPKKDTKDGFMFLEENLKRLEEFHQVSKKNRYRKCLVTCSEKNPKGRTRKVQRKALFHKWDEIKQVIDASPMIGGHPGGQIAYTLGIVEFMDGTVGQVSPGYIKFLDTEDFAGDCNE